MKLPVKQFASGRHYLRLLFTVVFDALTFPLGPLTVVVFLETALPLGPVTVVFDLVTL